MFPLPAATPLWESISRFPRLSILRTSPKTKGEQTACDEGGGGLIPLMPNYFGGKT